VLIILCFAEALDEGFKERLQPWFPGWLDQLQSV